MGMAKNILSSSGLCISETSKANLIYNIELEWFFFVEFLNQFQKNVIKREYSGAPWCLQLELPKDAEPESS